MDASHDTGSGDGRSALERLGRELAARQAEQETLERLKVARVEARRDRAAQAMQELAELMAAFFDRILEVAPTASVYSPQVLELEQARIEWDVDHEFVREEEFERSGHDVYAGAHIRLHQGPNPHDYPGCSASLWCTAVPAGTDPVWHEVAYNAAEGNAPAEEPFALKDLIKADIVASGDTETNLSHVAPPRALQGPGFEQFVDRWMGLLAQAAIGDLARPEQPAPQPQGGLRSSARPEPAPEPPAEDEDDGPSSNSLIGRLRGLGD